MASRTFLAGLLLCSIWGLARADDSTTKKPVSTLYNDKLGTTFSINLPEDSEDVNFFLSSPLFSWFGVGFSSRMAGSPMLLFYASADGKGQLQVNLVSGDSKLTLMTAGVTVSPRYATYVWLLPSDVPSTQRR